MGGIMTDLGNETVDPLLRPLLSVMCVGATATRKYGDLQTQKTKHLLVPEGSHLINPSSLRFHLGLCSNLQFAIYGHRPSPNLTVTSDRLQRKCESEQVIWEDL